MGGKAEVQDLEKEVFGESDGELLMFVVEMWDGFLKWAQGLVMASQALFNHKESEETADIMVKAHSTKLAVQVGATAFQKRLSKNPTIGLAYWELFTFQEYMIPLAEKWYEKFGEHGVWIDAINTHTGKRVPFHQDATTIINEVLSEMK